jgi:hypothetical protein
MLWNRTGTYSEVGRELVVLRERNRYAFNERMLLPLETDHGLVEDNTLSRRFTHPNEAFHEVLDWESY